MTQTDTKPLVSAIIPAHNRPNRLKRAVESVLSQDYENLELIVVDDCSKESLSQTQNLVESKNQTFVRLEKNSGVAAARNTGRKYAKGKFLAFLDSDDYWLPQKISTQVNFHLENPDFKISQCREIWYRNDVRVNQSKKYDMFSGDIFDKAVEYCVISSSSVFFTSSIYNQFEGYPEHFEVCEDYALWLKITAKYPIGLTPERLTVKYGGHADQLSKKYPAMDRFRVQALKEILEDGQLSVEQEKQAREQISKKSEILANGAQKRVSQVP